MQSWHNDSGRPLSASSWLLAHHQAKLAERETFARTLKDFDPIRIVDLGCGTGLWLDVLDRTMSHRCEFIGIDADPAALSEAVARSKTWGRKSTFLVADVEQNGGVLPEADLYLCFNLLCFVKDHAKLLQQIKERIADSGRVVIRQYDGAALRFGPMHLSDRKEIEKSLLSSLISSEQFDHFSMDKLYDSIILSPFGEREIFFDMFQRISPYPQEFIPYYIQTIEWTMRHLSESAAKKLLTWHSAKMIEHEPQGVYFTEFDLVAILS